MTTFIGQQLLYDRSYAFILTLLEFLNLSELFLVVFSYRISIQGIKIKLF